jgi:hypothetical protein
MRHLMWTHHLSTTMARQHRTAGRFREQCRASHLQKSTYRFDAARAQVKLAQAKLAPWLQQHVWTMTT